MRPDDDLDEEVRLGRAARVALAEAESRWRQALGSAAAERNTLRSEIKDLKNRLKPQQEDGHTAKKARIVREQAPTVTEQAMTRTEMYARYHESEEALRTEREKTASLEEQLNKLLAALQEQVPVLKERSTRLDAAVASNATLSENLKKALLDNQRIAKEAEEARAEKVAAHAAMEEVAASSPERKVELELRKTLKLDQLSAERRTAEAVGAAVSFAISHHPKANCPAHSPPMLPLLALCPPWVAQAVQAPCCLAIPQVAPLKEELATAHRELEAARADKEEAVRKRAEAEQSGDRWRVLYEGSLAPLEGGDDRSTVPSSPFTAHAAEVRALLLEGASGVARAKISSLEAELLVARTSDAGSGDGVAAKDVAQLKAKLATADTAADKLRKAAKHWKDKHDKLKDLLDAKASAATAKADSAAGSEVDGDVSTALESANARISELEAAMQAVVKEKAEAVEQAAATGVEVAALRAQVQAEEARMAAATPSAEATEESAGTTDGDSSAVAELKAKLAATDTTAAKLRKAAQHWKEQHDKLKEQHDQLKEQIRPGVDAAAHTTATSAADNRAASGSADEAGSSATLEAAQARVAELEAAAEASAKARADADEQAEAKVAAAEAKAAAAEAKALEAATAAESASASGATDEAVAEVDALKAKVSAAEASAEKMKKAAAHWKLQHSKVKEQMDASAAAAASTAASGGADEAGSSAALEAAQARATTLEEESKAALKEVETLTEQLEKFKRAAHHWKRQYDGLKNQSPDSPTG